MRNHYGVRVTSNAEVDRATKYLERKKNSVSRSSNRGETTRLIRFISTNPAGTIGRSSRTSMPLKWAWEGQQIRTGPNRFRQKSFRAKVTFPKLLPTALGKRGSRSLRALLPRSPWSRSREAVAQLLLRQTFSNALVRGLYSSPEARPPASFPLSAVYSVSCLGRCRTQSLSVI